MENQKDLYEQLKSNNSLSEIQEYIEKVLEIRGFADETVNDKLLHLSEELGELIKAVRKYSPNSFVDPQHSVDYGSVEEELADVFIMVIAVANKLNMNLFECLKRKERINMNRKWIKNVDALN